MLIWFMLLHFIDVRGFTNLIRWVYCISCLELYDLQTLCGGFVPSHIGSDCIRGLLKLVKIGRCYCANIVE
jgi:hypothetical protein